MIKGTGGFLNPEETIKQFNISKGMQVADFGCGAGYFVIPIAKIVGDESKVYALDILDTALESVRSRARIEGLFNIVIKRCNLEILNASQIENNSINVVLLSNILFQSDNKDGIIKEAIRILKPGGSLIIIDWLPGQLLGPSKNLIIPLEDIRKMAENNGLKFNKNIQIDNYHWGMIFNKILN
ncbi:MAG TPA: methyltransferase domain-containing protein [Candidatus Portnoybacteria bacterium]|jgi:ubiquinone/menaquinone biosynthesis C-methylase UbiE|nr:methyltransferase domain-containing protein [Candidatus Portnoybacteria bacterium]MDD5752255.1 methyltransferase domain-containing protein [Candidatus Portnoybacteria bacterium]HNU96754.1 methyltransferase domain-containing protein [Candidatus Portnoybacteria bacterium]HOZ16536.1 methyltransferase domain-containing protein [Candidatus Portnoybacteria bacterium]HPH52295.1 methyltransferase domain-containing protein [Candidatus Portnoybacteria bacterium]